MINNLLRICHFKINNKGSVKMFCKNCGYQLENKKFCPECGTPSNDDVPIQQPETPIVQQQPTAPAFQQWIPALNQKPQKKKLEGWQIALIVIGVLLAVGIFGNLLGGNFDGNNTNTNTNIGTTVEDILQTTSANAETTNKPILESTTAKIAEENNSVMENSMLNIMKKELKAYADVKFDKTTNTFLVIPTDKDLIDAIVILSNDTKNATLLPKWNDMVDGMKVASATISESLPGYNMSLINPLNQENTLLFMNDGEVIYNFVD